MRLNEPLLIHPQSPLMVQAQIMDLIDYFSNVVVVLCNHENPPGNTAVFVLTCFW